MGGKVLIWNASTASVFLKRLTSVIHIKHTLNIKQTKFVLTFMKCALCPFVVCVVCYTVRMHSNLDVNLTVRVG